MLQHKWKANACIYLYVHIAMRIKNAFSLCIKLFIMLVHIETTQCIHFENERIFYVLWDALSTMSNCSIVEYFIMISN